MLIVLMIWGERFDDLVLIEQPDRSARVFR
jgi:hypothetical protein